LRLLPIPLAAHDLWEEHWAPFLPRIAQRSHESIDDLRGQIERREVRLVLVVDDTASKVHALVGVRIHQMNGKSYADMVWLAGFGREQWQELLPAFEQLLRDAGCVACRPICRPGWSRYLKKQGYHMKHIIMEKPL
jgi:hypothetical protein